MLPRGDPMRYAFPLALLFLATTAHAQDPPGLGFAFRPATTGLVVTALADDGPAGPAGLRVDDVVTAVSGRSVVGLEPDAIGEWLTAVNGAGLPVTLDVARGSAALKVEVTPAPYSREALRAKAEAERPSVDLDDLTGLYDGTYLDLLESLARPSPDLAAFAEAMDTPPYHRKVTREGGRLAIASTTCTVWLTVSDRLVVTPSEAATHFKVEGPGIEVKCSGDPYQPEAVNLDVDGRESRDRAVDALRAILRNGLAAPAPSASAPRPADPATGCIAGTCADGTGTWRYASGATYEGAWRGGQRHGRGTYTFANGQTFTGDWVDGARVRGRETFESGNVYDGDYADDTRHGRGTMAYASGNAYTGDWADGKRHGRGTFTWPSGATFTGDWREGARVRGVNRYDDGRVYDGEYRDDQRHGQGTMTHPDGRVEAGRWEADALVAPATPPASAPAPTDPQAATHVCTSGNCTDGTGTMRYASGQTLTGTFKNGTAVRGLLTMTNGATYDGEFNAEGKFHGQGLYAFGPGEHESHTFQGTFANGTPSSGTYTWTDGQTYTGDWDGWTRTGQGVMKYANGNLYEGAWRDGQRHGRGTYTFASGGDFVGDWVDNSRVRGREEYTSGNVYEGEYADDKRHGQGTMTYASGDVFAGSWVAGDRIGQGTYTWADGKVYTGAWANNLRNGRGVMTFPNGNRYEGAFVDGDYYGSGVFTWPSGQRYEGAFADDQRHGQGTQYYADGRIFVGTWSAGSPVEGMLRMSEDAEARPVRNENGTFVYTD